MRECPTSRSLILLAVASIQGLCQVQVELKTSQATYLAGEPIFVVADVKNVGTYPVGYGKLDSDVDLTIEGNRKKQAAGSASPGRRLTFDSGTAG